MHHDQHSEPDAEAEQQEAGFVMRMLWGVDQPSPVVEKDGLRLSERDPVLRGVGPCLGRIPRDRKSAMAQRQYARRIYVAQATSVCLTSSRLISIVRQSKHGRSLAPGPPGKPAQKRLVVQDRRVGLFRYPCRARRLLPAPLPASAGHIQRTPHPSSPSVQHVRMHHRRRHIPMPEEFLDRSDAIAGFEKMRRERVSEGMTRRQPRNARGGPEAWVSPG